MAAHGGSPFGAGGALRPWKRTLADQIKRSDFAWSEVAEPRQQCYHGVSRRRLPSITCTRLEAWRNAGCGLASTTVQKHIATLSTVGRSPGRREPSFAGSRRQCWICPELSQTRILTWACFCFVLDVKGKPKGSQPIVAVPAFWCDLPIFFT